MTPHVKETFLTRFASEVHLFVRRDAMRASKIMAEPGHQQPKDYRPLNTEMVDVHGEKEVTGVAWKNNASGETGEIEVQGVFLAIGHTPNSKAFVPAMDHDDAGYLVTTPAVHRPTSPACLQLETCKTRSTGAVTAAGTGCAAALEAERWLEDKEAGE